MNMMNPMNFTTFMAHAELTFTSESIEDRALPGLGFDDKASHWKVTFSRKQDDDSIIEYSCEYSMGSAHTTDPEAADVLYGLQVDCEAEQYDSFEEWAENYDRDTDSRAAERLYNFCCAAAVGLRALLGLDHFETFCLLEED